VEKNVNELNGGDEEADHSPIYVALPPKSNNPKAAEERENPA
jgi:hypothetical protein